MERNHVARRIWRVVASLDLSRFERAVAGVAGRPSHSPPVLISVWLDAFAKGLHSEIREAGGDRGQPRNWIQGATLRRLKSLRPVGFPRATASAVTSFRLLRGSVVRLHKLGQPLRSHRLLAVLLYAGATAVPFSRVTG